jgi:CheY-like chemotaxis protein
VAVTALAMMGDRDKVLKAGFDGYIAKPIVPETFVSQMEAFLPPAQRTGIRPVSEERSAKTNDDLEEKCLVLPHGQAFRQLPQYLSSPRWLGDLARAQRADPFALGFLNLR